MTTLARFAVRHRWWIVAAWIVLIAALQGLAAAAGGATYRDDFSLPGTESDAAVHLLQASGQSAVAGIPGELVVHTRTGTARRPPAGVVTALTRLCAERASVVTVSSPWGGVACATGGTFTSSLADPTLLSSKDPSVALATITFAGDRFSTTDGIDVYQRLRHLRSPDLQLEFTGTAFSGLEVLGGGIPPEAFGFLAALVILALVFRTPGAVALPLLAAAAALGAGTAVISLLSYALGVSTVSPQLAQLMVIGVGVDYALFIVTRHRRNLLRGMAVPDSITAAVNTSGRAVLFAGTTVCIAMLGLCALGVTFFYGLAIGTAVAVAFTMIASLTLLPSMLGFVGMRVLTRKERAAVRDGVDLTASSRAGRIWASWSHFVARRKAVLGLLAAGLIVVLAIPFFGLRLGRADQGNDPSGTTTKRGYDLVSDAFGQGYNSVLTVVVAGPRPQQLAASVVAAVRRTSDVDPASVTALPRPLTPTLTLVTLKSRSSPQAAATADLVQHLRHDVLPPVYRGTGGRAYVYGQTAVVTDFSTVIGQKLPLFVGAVVLLSFVLLMIAFRSLPVPLTAALMNLFGAGAAFGVVVAVFQHGWGAGPLGIGSGAPVDPFIPVLFFAILFGLSMDYQVFLVSRMHEEWTHHRDNRRAVTVGQAETGGIITAAALIMMSVFAGFLLDDNRGVKLVGFGLAVAILIDAFVLRTVLVPAAMHVFGRANWWFPRWLDKVTPHLSVDPSEEPAEPVTKQQPQPTPSR